MLESQDVFPRCQKSYQHDENTDIVFQAISWHAVDHAMEDEDDESGKELNKFLVKVFGVTELGNTVSASIKGFPPFFFIKVPKNIKADTMFCTNLQRTLEGYMPMSLQKTLKSVKAIPMKDFWGFQNGKRWNFIRMTFTNMKGMRTAIRMFEKPVKIGDRPPLKYALYESNIEPFLRMIHMRNIQPTGWIRIPARYYQMNEGVLPSTCQIDVTCSWSCLEPVAIEKNAPIMVAAFDLECSSSHGDFPVAKKDYKKVATDLYYYFKDNMEDITGTDLVREICALFNKDSSIGSLPKVFTKQDLKQTTLKDIEKKMKECSYVYMGILRGRIKLENVDGRKRFVSVAPAAREKSSNQLNLNAIKKSSTDSDDDAGYDDDDDVLGPMKKDEILLTLTERLNMDLPALEGDAIIQIGVTVHQYGDRDCTYKHILTLGTCSPIEGAVVDQCESEADMLLKFRDLIVALDPDVITGYNILGFDMSYIWGDKDEYIGRAKELNIQNSMNKIGRLRDESCKFEIKTLSSSALGDNILKFIDMHGRVIIDIMKVVQRDHKLDSYKLDHVANHFMKMNKHDVSPKEIFALQKGSADDRRRIAEYCLQDCALCNRLIMKLEILANNIGMSNVCSVPLSYIFMRGQGIKIFSLVSKQCREEKMCIPTLSKPRFGEAPSPEDEDVDDSGYEGAIVLEPKTGIYLDDPVSVLDYASLYPSSMISENLSHDCIVLDPAYDNLPGLEYLDISYDLYEGVGDKKVKTGVKTCRFVQLPNGEKGIIPRILMKLLKARKDTRKKMAYETLVLEDGSDISGMVSEVVEDGVEKLKVARIDGCAADMVEVSRVKSRAATYDEFQLAVLDGLQLAYKVTANSLYGQCGARTSQIYMKEIAACTTATGRKMILTARDFILENYTGAEIIYGDSVTGDTPLLIKYPDETIDIVAIDSIVDEKDWSSYDNFKVTELQLSNKQQATVNARVWVNGQWADIRRVIRHYCNKTIYRVNTSRGCVDVTADHSLIDINGNQVKPGDCKAYKTKIMHSFPEEEDLDGGDITVERARVWGMVFTGKVPKVILNARRKVRESFFEGFLSDKIRKDFRFSCVGKLRAQGLYYIAKSVGYKNLRVSKSCLGDDGFWIYEGKDDDHYKDHVMTACQIGSVQESQYVYDIETATGQFHGGVGEIILKNTDSLFVKFPIKNDGAAQEHMDKNLKIRLAWDYGCKASSQIKKIIKPPHDLEMEKVFYPFILFSKKRYCAYKYEGPDSKPKLNSMGIVLKRRDNANIVKKVYGGCLDIIMNENDIKKSAMFLKNSIQDLIDGKYPLEDLVITKSLKADYKDPDKIAHKVLAERMGERDPGNKPQVNDRIPFAYVLTTPAAGVKKILQGDRIEHPDYIKKMNLKMDYEFYITNQISTPVCQLYALALDQLAGYKRPPGYWTDMEKKILKDKDGDVKKAKERLGDLMEAEAKSLLFDPILIKLKNRKEGNQDITRWFKPIVD